MAGSVPRKEKRKYCAIKRPSHSRAPKLQLPPHSCGFISPSTTAMARSLARSLLFLVLAFCIPWTQGIKEGAA